LALHSRWSVQTQNRCALRRMVTSLRAVSADARTTNHSNLTIGFGPHLRDSNPLDPMAADSRCHRVISRTRKVHFDNTAGAGGKVSCTPPSNPYPR
jgi:hypothetical protein